MRRSFHLLGLQTDCKKEHSVEAASCIISALIWKLSTPDQTYRGPEMHAIIFLPLLSPDGSRDIVMSVSSVRPYVRPSVNIFVSAE